MKDKIALKTQRNDFVRVGFLAGRESRESVGLLYEGAGSNHSDYLTQLRKLRPRVSGLAGAGTQRFSHCTMSPRALPN